jgi:hypothetical protein
MNPANYVILSAVLFSIGAIGVLVRRNAIVVFMCVELMLNAANLQDQRQSRRPGDRLLRDGGRGSRGRRRAGDHRADLPHATLGIDRRTESPQVLAL